jgi:hypothetical protein
MEVDHGDALRSWLKLRRISHVKQPMNEIDGRENRIRPYRDRCRGERIRRSVDHTCVTIRTRLANLPR